MYCCYIALFVASTEVCSDFCYDNVIMMKLEPESRLNMLALCMCNCFQGNCMFQGICLTQGVHAQLGYSSHLCVCVCVWVCVGGWVCVCMRVRMCVCGCVPVA